MLDVFRHGEVLPEERTNEEERLVNAGKLEAAPGLRPEVAGQGARAAGVPSTANVGS
jgi:hypothetical protein